MTLRKGIASAMAVILACSSMAVAAPIAHAEGSNDDNYQYITDISGQRIDETHYFFYRDKFDNVRPLHTLTLKTDKAVLDENTSLSAGQDGQNVQFDKNGRATWTADVPEEGFYRLRLRYRYTDDSVILNSKLTVKLNGELPFEQAEGLELPRIWADAGEITQDANGNDLKPAQKQVLEMTEMDLLDESGYVREYYFHFTKGSNQITLEVDDGYVEVESITLYNEQPVSYEEYLKDKGEHTAKDYMERVQAEDILWKNESSLVPARDRTSAATMPNDPVLLKLNVLSGTAFKTPGQTVSYSFSVPEDGYYKIGMRAKQSHSEGVAVSRRLTVDGKLLFSEMEGMTFPYSEKWGFYTFGGDEPYLMYLEAGEHTLEMEVTTGESGELAKRLEDAIYVLNYIYRKIIMITGTTPDPYRDFNLEKEIPEMLPIFKELITEFKSILSEVERLSNTKGGQTSILQQMIAQLEDFVDDSIVIPDQLERYKSNISAVSTLLLVLLEQPLTIDYIMVMGEDYTVGKTEASFWQSLVFQVKAFFGSFTNDYVSISGTADGSATEQIEVWFNGGREQAEILKQQIDSDFTLQHGIGVNIKLVQISLTQAVLAGTAPDVVMNVARGQPINLAARKVLMELSQFEGFEEMKSWFAEDGLVPYTYNGGVYAMPVTLDYLVMFYRKDILAELNLEVPQTWEDVYAMIPILQRQSLMFGLPYTVLNNQSTVDVGMGAKDIFPALFLQRGGSYYKDDLTEVNLDTTAAMSAFKEWTEFYSLYGFELEYNFYNRFRAGETPISIQLYSQYNQLKAAAPEINGLWDIALIPGTERDGKIDRSQGATGSAAVMLSDTANPEASWKFIQWWTSAEAQANYGLSLEMLMGTASRYAPANVAAMEYLPWTDSELSILKEQMSYIKEIPEVVGGYYTTRGIDNAFRNVRFNEENYRESLMEQIQKINDELARKKKEIDNLR